MMPLTQPSLTDIIRSTKKSVKQETNCVQVGKINSYDAAKGTAKIQIMVKRVQLGKIVSYPLLLDCPVYMVQGGTGSVYMPIQAGDECIVLFADRNIDIWHSTGTEAAPANSRCHDLADGIALVGIRSLVNPPTARATGEAGIANGAVRLGLASGKANIQNATTSMLKLITDFIDVLKGLQVLDPISGALPLTAAVIAQLDAQKTTFAALLYKD
jgi:hypothetical protein